MTALLFPDEAARLVPGEQLMIVRAGDGCCSTLAPKDLFGVPRHDCTFVAPQAWVALTGPCPNTWHSEQLTPKCCRDGRRIEPLYTECRTCLGNPMKYLDLGYCPKCGPPRGLVLVGRGSIEVVPVTSHAMFYEFIVGLNAKYRSDINPQFDPLPVPGRDWGIVIDCVEVTP